MKTITLFFAIIISILFFSSCQSPTKNELIIGEWKKIKGKDKYMGLDKIHFFKDSTWNDNNNIGALLSTLKYKIYQKSNSDYIKLSLDNIISNDYKIISLSENEMVLCNCLDKSIILKFIRD